MLSLFYHRHHNRTRLIPGTSHLCSQNTHCTRRHDRLRHLKPVFAPAVMCPECLADRYAARWGRYSDPRESKGGRQCCDIRRASEQPQQQQSGTLWAGVVVESGQRVWTLRTAGESLQNTSSLLFLRKVSLGEVLMRSSTELCLHSPV